MTVRVTLRRLFAGQLLGGHSPVEFERMTEPERLAARLTFIADRAAVLAALPYSPANDMPANIHAEARKLNTAARNTLALLEAGREISRAVSCALAVGTAVQRIESILATAAALDVTEQLVQAAPDIRRGSKVHSAAKEGAKTTNKQHIAKWPQYQADVNDKKRRNPKLSYAEICRQVAIMHGVSAKTISRNTTNPATK